MKTNSRVARRITGGLIQLGIEALDPKRQITQLVRKQMPRVIKDHNNIFCLSELAYHVQSYDLISFDFFDTVATRDCSLATVMERTADFGTRAVRGDHGPIARSVFLAARGNMADAVKTRNRSRHQQNEIVLTDLFERALRPFIADAATRKREAQKLVAFETQSEIVALGVDPEFIDLADALQAAGKRMILISDMYLPQANMELILERLDVRKYFESVFISAHEGVTKNSGDLFDVVAGALQMDPSRILHVGDNYTNDCVRPRERGWNALHYFHHDNEFERREFEHRERLARKDPVFRHGNYVDTFAQSDAKDDLAHLIATVIAPVFTLFVVRSLEYAERHRLDRLYFLTRDGTIFEEIAKRVQRRFPLFHGAKPDALRRLEVNRATMILLQFKNLADLNWATHCAGYLADRPFSLAALLSCFHLEVDNLEGLSAHEHQALAAMLDCEDQGSVLDFFAAHPRVRRSFEALLRSQRDLTLRYLKQERVLDTDRSAFVDIGYSGTVAKFLSEYMLGQANLDDHDRTQIHCLLFATNRFYDGNIAQMHPGVVLNPGLIVSHEDLENKGLVMNFGWLEPFAVDPERGRLVRYESRGGHIAAKFAEPFARPERQRLRDMMLAEVDEILDPLLFKSPVTLDEYEKEIVERLRRFVKTPTARQVHAMENLLHDFGIISDESKGIVERLRLWDVVSKLRKHRANDVWIQGSLRRSNLQWTHRFVDLWARRAL